MGELILDLKGPCGQNHSAQSSLAGGHHQSASFLWHFSFLFNGIEAKQDKGKNEVDIVLFSFSNGMGKQF
jgi:hypothetical protein